MSELEMGKAEVLRGPEGKPGPPGMVGQDGLDGIQPDEVRKIVREEMYTKSASLGQTVFAPDIDPEDIPTIFTPKRLRKFIRKEVDWRFEQIQHLLLSIAHHGEVMARRHNDEEQKLYWDALIDTLESDIMSPDYKPPQVDIDGDAEAPC